MPVGYSRFVYSLVVGVMTEDNEGLSWPVLLIAIPFNIGIMVWAVWVAVVLFMGGPLPLVTLYVTRGDVLIGILFVLIGIPIIEAVALWVTYLLVVPIELAVRHLRR